MTFASIYLLHFDFAFNSRAIHGVYPTWGMRNRGSQEHSLDTPESHRSSEGGTLDRLHSRGELEAALLPAPSPSTARI